MDVLKLRYLIREAIEDTIKQQSTFKIGNKVTTVDGDTAKVTMAEHPFYTVELESTGTTKSYKFQDLAPFVEKEVEPQNEGFLLKENVNVSPGLEFHHRNKINLLECVYRIGSDAYINFYSEAKKLLKEGKIKVNTLDKEVLETNIGEYGTFKGEKVPLDLPTVDEAEYRGKDVPLNKPKRGGTKKFVVYTKNDKGKVVKVNFGGTTGLNVKIDEPGARASFAARHKCAQKKDKTKPGYWACNIGRYWKSLGGKRNFSGYW